LLHTIILYNPAVILSRLLKQFLRKLKLFL
jgi:hypothetical protein